MVDAAHTITSIIPTAMAAGLVADNMNYLKKKKKKSLLGLGIKNIVGVNLIQATAQAGDW